MAPDGNLDDFFGSSVSLSASGDTVLVGAIYDDTQGGYDAGSAYVFTGAANGSWNYLQNVLAPDGAADDNFGSSVSLSSSSATALIGAPSDDTSGGLDTGSAYVLTLPDIDSDGVLDSVDNCPTDPARKSGPTRGS